MTQPVSILTSLESLYLAAQQQCFCFVFISFYGPIKACSFNQPYSYPISQNLSWPHTGWVPGMIFWFHTWTISCFWLTSVVLKNCLTLNPGCIFGGFHFIFYFHVFEVQENVRTHLQDIYFLPNKMQINSLSILIKLFSIIKLHFLWENRD